MENKTYKKGQVEWALWRAFRPTGSRDDGPVPVFRTRIKRLLDLDREPIVDGQESGSASEYAFVATPDGGKGAEAAYEPVDAFCLGLALDLLDVGFKQSEVVFLMRHLRSELDDWFPRLMKRPSLVDRQDVIAKQHPRLPKIKRGAKAAVVDARVFLLLGRIELTEVLSGIASDQRKKQPAVFPQPVYCEGIVELGNVLDELMPHHRRTVIILELAKLAHAVSDFLAVAPAVPRGRPRREK